MDADDHAFVQLGAVADEHAAALLQREDRIRDGFALFVADQHAVVALGNLALDDAVAVEDVAREAGAARHRHELALEADQAAGRHAILDAHAAVAIDDHVREFRFSQSELLHHRTLVLFRDVHRQGLERLLLDAVDDLLQHLRLADGQFIALAPHVLDQDGQVQFAATGDAEHVGIGGVFDAQRDVALELAIQAIADLAAGHELAFAAGERRGVDLEIHHERRLVDIDRRQAFRRDGIADREADRHVFDAGHGDDVARAGFGNGRTLETAERQHLHDAARTLVLFAVTQHDIHAGLDRAATYAADADAPDIAVVVQRRDLQLQRRIRIRRRRGHVRDDRIEQCLHRRRLLALEARACPALQRRGVDDREVELLVRGAELVEQFEGAIHDPVRARTGTVHLVHHDNRLVAHRERLARHEARLRHRAFDGVHDDQHAVDHRQHALHFSTEVGVARRIDDVDARALVLDRAVLREDRDAALALDVVRVHDAFADALVGCKGTGLLQQAVDERGLAVIDVRDDGDVAD